MTTKPRILFFCAAGGPTPNAKKRIDLYTSAGYEVEISVHKPYLTGNTIHSAIIDDCPIDESTPLTEEMWHNFFNHQ